MENVTYLSDNVQSCFENLFYTIDKKENFRESLFEVAVYLTSDSDKYDDFLGKYIGVNKNLLKQMILSNFLEMNYYRQKMGIKLDDERLNILKAIETDDLNDNSFLLLYCDLKLFAKMINDVLLYLYHPSEIYSYNVVNCIIKDGFNEKLYSIYPLALSEHILTLNDKFTTREFLIFTLIEIIINATEKLYFSEGKSFSTDSTYIQEVSNKLKQHNGNDTSVFNLYKQIIDDFKNRIGNNYNKVLMIEIFISFIQFKRNYCIPISILEKDMLEIINKNDYSKEDLIVLYDNNEEQIISLLIDNWSMFLDEDFSYINLFEDIKDQDFNQR